MMAVYTLSFPERHSPNFVASSRSKLKPYLRNTQTYSEYWRDQIEKYNRSAHIMNRETINGEQVFHALATAHEKTEELDLLAITIRQLGDAEDPEETIMPDIIRHVAQAQGIIFGEKYKKKILEGFGYQE